MEHACGAEHCKNWFIYCQGRILEAVNAHRLYNDSKDFVDSPLKDSPDAVLAAFNAEFGPSTNVWQIDKHKLRTFVDAHFAAPGSELDGCVPEDW